MDDLAAWCRESSEINESLPEMGSMRGDLTAFRLGLNTVVLQTHVACVGTAAVATKRLMDMFSTPSGEAERSVESVLRITTTIMSPLNSLLDVCSQIRECKDISALLEKGNAQAIEDSVRHIVTCSGVAIKTNDILTYMSVHEQGSSLALGNPSVIVPRLSEMFEARLCGNLAPESPAKKAIASLAAFLRHVARGTGTSQHAARDSMKLLLGADDREEDYACSSNAFFEWANRVVQTPLVKLTQCVVKRVRSGFVTAHPEFKNDDGTAPCFLPTQGSEEAVFQAVTRINEWPWDKDLADIAQLLLAATEAEEAHQGLACEVAFDALQREAARTMLLLNDGCQHLNALDTNDVFFSRTMNATAPLLQLLAEFKAPYKALAPARLECAEAFIVWFLLFFRHSVCVEAIQKAVATSVKLPPDWEAALAKRDDARVRELIAAGGHKQMVDLVKAFTSKLHSLEASFKSWQEQIDMTMSVGEECRDMTKQIDDSLQSAGKYVASMQAANVILVKMEGATQAGKAASKREYMKSLEGMPYKPLQCVLDWLEETARAKCLQAKRNASTTQANDEGRPVKAAAPKRRMSAKSAPERPPEAVSPKPKGKARKA